MDKMLNSDKVRCGHCFGSKRQMGSMGSEDCRPCNATGYLANKGMEDNSVLVDKETPRVDPKKYAEHTYKVDKRTKEYKASKVD